MDEICALLRCYAAHTGNSSQIFRDKLSAPSSRVSLEDGAEMLSRNVGKELPIYAARRYLGTTLTNQNSIAEEIKSRLRSGNACYYSVQNLLSSRLLSKNLKIKIYRIIILPVFSMGVKLGR